MARIASVRNRFFVFILFYLVFFLPPISYLVLTFPSLFSLSPLLSCQLPRRRCCHGYRAAGQISWCLVSFRHVHKSASCMCARSLPSLQWAPLSSYLSTKHKLDLQCDHTYSIYTLSSIVYMQLCSAWCFSWPVDSINSKHWTQEVPAYALPRSGYDEK